MLLKVIVLLVGLLGSCLGAAAQPVDSPTDSLLPYRRGALWGYATPARQLVINPQYTYAERFDHGLARVWLGRKCGFIDARGRIVVPIRFDRAGYYQPAAPSRSSYQQGASSIWAGGYGRVVVMLRDSLTKPEDRSEDGPALPPWFDAEWASYPGTDHWGLYDSLGRVLLRPDYAFLALRPDGLLAATRVAQYFSGSLHEGENINYYKGHPIYEELLLTAKGRPLLQGHAYTSLGEIVAGHLSAHVSRYPRGYWGGDVLVDTATGLAAPQQYGNFQPLGEDYGFAAQIFYQAEPNSVPYSEEDHTSDEHHVQVSWRRSVVWLTTAGQPRTAQQYLALTPAAAGQAVAMLGASASLPNRAGVLSLRTGQWLIAPRYQEIVYFDAGNYLAREQGRWGLLGAQGQWLVPPRYEGWRNWEGYPPAASPAHLAHTVLVRRAGKWGVLNAQGREEIASIYNELVPEPDGYRACRDLPAAPGRPARLAYGALTARGRVRVPLRYERLERCYTTRGQPLPYWQAWQAGYTLLLSHRGRVLLSRAGYGIISGFYRGRALLQKDKYANTRADYLGFIVLSPAGKAQWQPLGPELISQGFVWHDTQGRLVWQRERLGAPGRYGLVQVDTAAGPEPVYALLTAADTTRLTPLCYDAMEPQPEQEARTIPPYMRVRQGQLLGVLSTTGQVVVPVQYTDIIWPERPHQVGWPVGENGVFWVRPPGGNYQAVGPGGRVLRDTGSPQPPALPYYYERGYGLLARDVWDVTGYVDALGNPFFEEVPAYAAPAQPARPPSRVSPPRAAKKGR